MQLVYFVQLLCIRKLGLPYSLLAVAVSLPATYLTTTVPTAIYSYLVHATYYLLLRSYHYLPLPT